MAYQPVEGILPKMKHNVYNLVMIAAQRAQELAKGSPKLVETSSGGRSATVALEEILAGKVGLKTPEEGSRKGKKK